MLLKKHNRLPTAACLKRTKRERVIHTLQKIVNRVNALQRILNVPPWQIQFSDLGQPTPPKWSRVVVVFDDTTGLCLGKKQDVALFQDSLPQRPSRFFPSQPESFSPPVQLADSGSTAVRKLYTPGKSTTIPVVKK